MGKLIAGQIQGQKQVDFVLVQLVGEEFGDWLDQGKVILVHTVMLADGKCIHAVNSVSGTIKNKQQSAALMSLDLLRRYLMFNPR